MSAGNAVSMGCPPNCYAKVVEAVSKTQHQATQEKLDAIIANQTTLIHGVNQVVTVIANLANLSKNLDDHKTEAEKKFDTVFSLLRATEDRIDDKISKGDMVKIITIIGIAVGVLEVIFRWVLPR